MSITIDEAISRIPVQPGRPYRTRVNGQDIEVRVVPAEIDSEETPVDQIWLTEPPAAKSIVLTLKRGEPDLPAPIRIDESDLAPE